MDDGLQTRGDPRLIDVEHAIHDWYQFDLTSRTKVIARRREHTRLDSLSARAMRVARRMQDDGMVSVLTRRRGGMVIFMLERVPE